jgi:hypothetical protein
MAEQVAKPPGESYELLVDNFEFVQAGEAFARADGETLQAAEPFYPILMSAGGYADVFGFEGYKLGENVSEARAALDSGSGGGGHSPASD